MAFQFVMIVQNLRADDERSSGNHRSQPLVDAFAATGTSLDVKVASATRESPFSRAREKGRG